MEDAKRVRIGGISKTAREALEVALVANVALDGSGFGDVGEIFNRSSLAHFDDCIDGDMT